MHVTYGNLCFSLVSLALFRVHTSSCDHLWPHLTPFSPFVVFPSSHALIFGFMTNYMLCRLRERAGVRDVILPHSLLPTGHKLGLFAHLRRCRNCAPLTDYRASLCRHLPSRWSRNQVISSYVFQPLSKSRVDLSFRIFQERV